MHASWLQIVRTCHRSTLQYLPHLMVEGPLHDPSTADRFGVAEVAPGSGAAKCQPSLCLWLVLVVMLLASQACRRSFIKHAPGLQAADPGQPVPQFYTTGWRG